MAAETIPIDNLAVLMLLLRQRPSTASDNLNTAGMTGAATTLTGTFVYTPGATPADSTLTCNLVAVGP